MTTKENVGQTRTQSSSTPFKEEKANQQHAPKLLADNSGTTFQNNKYILLAGYVIGLTIDL